jgi:hypothetical protein
MGKESTKKSLLVVCQMAYRKHVLDDDRIGWEELSENLAMTLSQEMGDKEFVRWLDSISPHLKTIME